MKAKLIKTEEGYTLNDLEGNPIGQTFGKFKGKKISLKNCEAIANGYDFDELVIDEIPDSSSTTLQVQRMRFIHGFQKAVEILGDKKFSDEDLKKAFFHVQNEPTFDIFIQSLQQTEWEVEIEMCIEYTEGGYPVRGGTPRLDADGCLILKRK